VRDVLWRDQVLLGGGASSVACGPLEVVGNESLAATELLCNGSQCQALACHQANLFQFFGSGVGASAFLRLTCLTGELFANGSEDGPGILGTASTNACAADCPYSQEITSMSRV
jgi:hypothetical protein